MKKIASVFLLAMGIAPVALAQSSQFGGFSMATSLSTNMSNSTVSANSATITTGNQTGNIGLQATYGFPLSPRFVLNLGGSYELLDKSFGAAYLPGAFQFELKGINSYAMQIEGVEVLSETTAVYAKYSALHMDATTNFNNATHTFVGGGFGIGLRHFINRHDFIQLEINESRYSTQFISKVEVAPSTLSASLGIGFKF
jgi:Outer membrane protein beta-barrel domain